MTETNKRREIRVVGYEKRLVVAQLQLLAAVLLLPAMAVSDGWAAGFLCVAFFLLILSVFAQIWKLRTTGVIVTIEELDSEIVEAAAELSAEEAPEELPEQAPPTPEEPAKPLLHWSDVSYPDPDVELGLKEAPADSTAAAKAGTSAMDSRE